jgi:hypothetical protein
VVSDIEAAKRFDMRVKISHQLSVPDRLQKRICMDTVFQSKRKFATGPSVEEAEKILLEKFGFTDRQIASLQISNVP